MNNRDVAKGWFIKGDSDLAAVRVCLEADQCLDTACFHAQQAAEKYIKSYLAANDIAFPFIHNLEKLIELCATLDESFLTIKRLAGSLTPYAVTLRYDNNFWPDEVTVKEAIETAETVREFILERLPTDARP